MDPNAPTDSEAEFTRAALALGHLSPEELAAARAEQRRLAGQGQPRPLVRLLLDVGALDDAGVREVTRRMGRRAQLYCARCRRSFTVLGKLGAATPACRRCGDPLTALPATEAGAGADDPLVGRVLGERYAVERRIGRGAMGAVYQARHLRLDRPCAVKVLPPGLAPDAPAVQRFGTEARLAGQLDDQEHVVTVFDVVTDGPVQFIAMELVDGNSLEDRIASGPLPWREAVDLVRQAATGLAAAHRRGILHRDVKPANLMLQTDGGRLKVMDFGLARLAETDGAASSGAVVGTPLYMSPEQSGGRDVDLRTDIYSLGATFYALVTGQAPFEGGPALGILLKLVEEDPTPPGTRVPALPPALDGLIMQMLARDPNRRPPDMESVIEALDRLLASPTPVPAAPSSAAVTASVAPAPPGERGRRRRRRRVQRLLAFAGLQAVLIGVIFGLAIGWDRTPQRPPPPPAPATGPDAAAYEQLVAQLLDSDLPDADKARACESFIQAFPGSEHLPRVIEHLRHYDPQTGYRALDPLRREVEALLAEGRVGEAAAAVAAAPASTDPATREQLRQRVETARARRVGRLRAQWADADASRRQALEAELRALGATPPEPVAPAVDLDVPDPAELPRLLVNTRRALAAGRPAEAARSLARLARAVDLPEPTRRERALLGAVAEALAALAADREPAQATVPAAGQSLLADGGLALLDDRVGTARERLLERLAARVPARRGALQRRRGDLALARGAVTLARAAYRAAAEAGALSARGLERLAALDQLAGDRAAARATLKRSPDPGGITGRAWRVALAPPDRRDAALRALAREGLPLAGPLATRLGLERPEGDRLHRTDGRVDVGRARRLKDGRVELRWRDGDSERLMLVAADDVRRVQPSAVDAGALRQALTSPQPPRRLHALADWADLLREPQLARQLRLQARAARAAGLQRLGIACAPCDASGRVDVDCARCAGRGQLASPCAPCAGKGHRPCGPCSGSARVACPGPCKGSGKARVRIRRPSGWQLEERTCGDCRGRGTIRCLRCRGGRQFVCADCGGEGLTQRRCPACAGRRQADCTRCRGRGHLFAPWDAFRLAMAYHALELPAALPALWQQLQIGRAQLSREDRTWLAGRLRTLGEAAVADALTPN